MQFLAVESTDRSDTPWRRAANDWLQCKADFGRAKQRLDETKNNMILLGVGRGAGVEIAQHERQGSVDWKSGAKMLWTGKEDDFEPWSEIYRKSASFVTTIKEIKGES